MTLSLYTNNHLSNLFPCYRSVSLIHLHLYLIISKLSQTQILLPYHVDIIDTCGVICNRPSCFSPGGCFLSSERSIFKTLQWTMKMEDYLYLFPYVDLFSVEARISSDAQSSAFRFCMPPSGAILLTSYAVQSLPSWGWHELSTLFQSMEF